MQFEIFWQLFDVGVQAVAAEAAEAAAVPSDLAPHLQLHFLEY